jgi:hypothetical protein
LEIAHIKGKFLKFGNAALKIKKEVTVTTPRITGLRFSEICSENPNLSHLDAGGYKSR